MGMRYELKNCLVPRMAIIIQSSVVYLCVYLSHGHSVCLYSLSLVVPKEELKLLLSISFLHTLVVKFVTLCFKLIFSNKRRIKRYC